MSGPPTNERRPREGADDESGQDVKATIAPIRQPAMKAAERAQLMTVANERARLAKDDVRAFAAERVVQLNAQLEADWKAEDFQLEQMVDQLQDLAEAANERIAAECDRLGILPELRPQMHGGFVYSHVKKERRAQLRQVLKDENDAAVRRASHAIDTWRTNTREALVRDGLTSAAAVEFLDSLPTPAQLLPEINIKALSAKRAKR